MAAAGVFEYFLEFQKKKKPKSKRNQTCSSSKGLEYTRITPKEESI